ncbi:hypothetical protein ACFFGH_02610 [Lysobacter korlensis]|uniref:Uncharacterized protein n=1 Tax=Lysobacter korlensis TaxID=553636 RepID=A0ABV6RIC7_9GAMM
MPIMRKIVKLAVGYALTKALARHGGPKGLLNAVMSSASGARGRGDYRSGSGYSGDDYRPGSDNTGRYKRGSRRRDF